MRLSSPRFPLGLAAALLALLGLSTAPAAETHPWIKQYTNTMTCLVCHGPGSPDVWGGDVTPEIMQSSHWTWDVTTDSGQKVGKRHIINNYCIAIASNEPRCTSCHIGFGWRDNSFNFSSPTNIDCLVCHDTTGTYVKTPTGAGMPDPSVNLTNVARNVGRTSRKTCGACHFFGGGGDAVKHGDLDSTMTNPKRSVDVHMGTDGLNQNCAFCHQKEGHIHSFVGTSYSAKPEENLSCTRCHNPGHRSTVPDAYVLNMHAARVACQTCHIPSFARGGKATTMTWDWSTAGIKGPDGKDKIIKDANGNPIYDTKKGTFTWESNVTPTYIWFNGDMKWVSPDDTVSSNSLVSINQLRGGINDATARIYPVKRFTGIQPYDAGSNTLAVPHLFPTSPTDSSALWKFYDWNKALVTGQQAVGRTYSGQLGFLSTEMFWVQNHMVVPKENSLHCVDCHSPSGRLDFAALGYSEERAPVLQNLFAFQADGFEAQPDTQGTSVTLKWTMTPGFQYEVQYSDDLVSWHPAANGSFTASSTTTEQTWSNRETGVSARYYKIARTEKP